MAKTEITVPDFPLKPAGIDDTQPVAQQSLAFFRQQGIAIQFGEASRMNGKKLLKTHSGEHILAIHSDSRNAIWVQTNTQLILYTDFFHAFL